MPNWGELLNRINQYPNPHDDLRRKYLSIMEQYTGRNVIAYYSAFLQKPGIEGTSINDNDKNAFMQAVYMMDRSKGLDLILHTSGGQIAAAESLVGYLKCLFGNDIRTFVPQMAMSAGTMIALSTKEIVMGKQSNLGPIDPQFGGMSCAGILDEFKRACTDITANPKLAAAWGPIISKYHPTFIGDCENAVKWAEEMCIEWLRDNMFSSLPDKDQKATAVISALSSHSKTYSHSRHISANDLKALGLKIVMLEDLNKSPLEDCKDLQDCVLTIHHAYMHTFSNSTAIKIVENHLGNAMIISNRDGGQ